MDLPSRTMRWTGEEPDSDPLLTREWLVANGLGGYASGTVSGVLTRRYHGVLIAALPAPLGRVVMLTHLSEMLRLPDGTHVRLGGEERAGPQLELHGAGNLREFRLDGGIPVWRYDLGHGLVLEKRILLVHLQNTVHVSYRLVEGTQPVRLKLRPSMHFRHHEAPVSTPLDESYVLTAVDGRFEISAGNHLPSLRLLPIGEHSAFTVDCRCIPEVLYRIEESRGYDYTGELWTPGHFRVTLQPGAGATFIASTEPWEAMRALTPEAALQAERARRTRVLARAPPALQRGPAAELVLAADSFLVIPSGRIEDAARVHASGDEVRSVIAGYHWFTDWGRDTMISLEGLSLVTGRQLEAGYILRTFASYVRDGLIPNLFPDGKSEGLYHTADATLWFFHALDRYLDHTGDRVTLRQLLPVLEEIVERHVQGTRFGIGVDPGDGLLRQGAPGYQLTWMDAKVDDWVVTPRRGKTVEINALWHNALRLLATWQSEEGNDVRARELSGMAERVRRSFNERFWFAEGGHLYDVVDGEGGDDSSCRPNQILALGLHHPVLRRDRWEPVFETVRRRLWTPVGLRSLAPGHPDYRPKYYGDLRTRDAAYHQGTVWAWLVGPFLDALVRVHPKERATVRQWLSGLVEHLGEACIGSVSEIFDADEPFHPRGCVSQAWSVAEVLRCWAMAERLDPHRT